MIVRRVVPLLLALALAAPAAEIALGDGWKDQRSLGASGATAIAGAGAEITVERGRFARIERALGLDGSDAAPLRIQCAIAVEGDQPLRSEPAQMTVTWPGALLAVGIAARDNRQDERVAVARWVIDGTPGEAFASSELYPGGCPAHVRIVVASNDVSAWSSRDGWIWQRLASFPRASAFAGPAVSVALGKGWPAQGLSLDRDVQPDAKVMVTLRFSGFLASDVPPTVPASLLKTYQKAASRDDALEALTLAGLPRQWWLSGPFPNQRKQLDAPVTTPFDPKATFAVGGTSLGWTEHRIGDNPNDRLVVASKLIPAGGGVVRYAATTITCDAPRLERFLFDGGREITLFVNGHVIATDRLERQEEVAPDRLAALVPLSAGVNTVLVRLVADDRGGSAFTLRHEAGDPRHRIALLRRLAVDFPEDPEALVAAHIEVSRLWEGLGCLSEAAAALDEAAKVEDAPAEQIEAALVERARLHAALRDEAAVAADIETVSKRWADQSSDQLAASRKSANLWVRMGLPAKALAALGEAAARPGIDPTVRLDLGLERLRLLQRLGDEAGLVAELSALAKALPESDPRRVDLLAAVALRVPRGAEATALAALPGARAQRLSAGIAAARGDRAGVLAALKVLAAQPPTGPLDVPAVVYAEALAAAGDTSGAVAAYRTACAAIGVAAPAEDLAALRIAFVRGCLAETPAGAKLIEDAKDAPAIASDRLVLSDLQRWSVVGPFTNDNWSAYAKPPVRADAVDTTKPVEGKPWLVPGPEFYRDGALDLAALLKADHCVAFCYAEVASTVAGQATLSMGSDDALVVWVNGKKVHEDREQRGLQPDSIKLTVPVEKGANRILAMVQQGNGGWGLQARLLTPGWLEADVAHTLRFLGDHPGRRADIAQALAGLSDTLARNGRGVAGAALARTVLRAFPDCWEAQQATVVNWLDPQRARQDAVGLRDALLWLDANLPLHPAAGDALPAQVDLRLQVATRLADGGELSAAADSLAGVLWSVYDDRTQARTLRAQGDLLRATGYARRAADCYAQALLLPGINEGDERAMREALTGIVRARRTGGGVANVSFDVATALRSAQRSADNGDLERAIPALQKAIEGDSGQVIAIEGGRLSGVSRWCAERLRALGDAGVAAYRAKYEAKAASQLALAAAHDDVDGCERVAAVWPITVAADQALAAAARGYLDRGAWALAAATVESLPDAALSPRASLLAAAVRAAALSGDPAAHARLAERLAQLGVAATFAGQPIDARAWSAEQARLLPTSRSAPWPTGARATVPFTVPAVTLRDLRRFVSEGGRTVHAACQAAIVGDVAYLDTGAESLAVELGSGQVRWRVATDGETGSGRGRFHGLSTAQPALCGEVVVGRAARGARRVLQARARTTGEVAWTATVPGFDAVSSPTSDGARVLALFADEGRVAVASFAAGDGALCWLTVLPVPRASLGGVGDAGIDLGGELAAPTIAGREAFVATDAGAVLALDAGSGRVRWLARYPTATPEGRSGLVQLLNRPAGRCVVIGDRVAVLPRDSLGLFSFTRADGAVAWSREFAAGRVLIGDVAGGLVLQGVEVEAIDPQAGATRWRWRPRDGVVIGQAVVDANGVTVATHAALHRLGRDGRETAATPWRELGVTGSAPGALTWDGDHLVAVGNGGLAVLGAGKPVAGLPSLVPAVATVRAQQIAALPAASGDGFSARWRLGGDAVVALERPAGAAPGECYAQGARSFTRLDAATPAVVWRTGLSGDATLVGFTADGVLLRMRGALAMLSRADGAVQWLSPLEEDVGRSLVDDQEPEVALVEGAVLVYRGGWNHDPLVEIRDARSGRLQRRVEAQGRIVAATIHAGQVHVLCHRQDKLWLDAWSLADGALIASQDLGVRGDDTGSTVLPGGGILLYGRINGFYDPAARVLKAAPVPLRDRVGSWIEEGGLVHCIGMEDQRWSSVVIDPAKLAIVFAERFTQGWAPDHGRMRPWAWRPAPGGRWLRLERDRGGKNGVVCLGANGKEAWYVPGVENWRRRYQALGVVGDTAVALFSEGGVMSAQVIALGDGKVIATVPVPGGEVDAGMPLLVMGDTILFGGEAGIIALSPGQASAVVASAPPAERELRDFALAAPNPPPIVPRLASTPASDGQLGDWPADVGTIVLGPGSVRERGAAAAAPAGDPRLRLGWDATAFHLAVEAVATGWHPPAARGASGDRLVVAVDGLDDNRSPLLLGLALVDGRPEWDVLHGAIPTEAEAADQPRLRIAAGPTGAVYELALPWPLLRSKPEQRPGDHRRLRLGVAVLAVEGAAREWGHGIVRGFVPDLLPSVELGR